MISFMFGILVIFVFVGLVAAYLNLESDKLIKYKDILNLRKANLVYSSNFQKVKDLVLPTRKTVFRKSEPVIWLYKEDKTELFIGANWKSDVRIWLKLKKDLRGVHIVLDSTGNNLKNFKSNLRGSKLPEQAISLEGDFSKYFKLYCNKGQQVIALQIIAPNVMAYILDNLAHVDIEIIDNQVAIVVKGGAKTITSLRASIELAKKIDVLTKATNRITKH